MLSHWINVPHRRQRAASRPLCAVPPQRCEMAGEADLDTALAAADCAVVVTDHSSYDWAAIRQRVGLIVDTRHVVERE